MVTGLIIGWLPGLLFAVRAIIGTVFTLPGVGGGDAPLWSITVAFAAVSMTFALIGFLIGTAIWHLECRWLPS